MIRAAPAVVWLAGACSRPAPPPAANADVTGTLTVDGAPAQLVACRPGHAVHVFVDVESAKGTLRFGEGKLAWNGSPLTCSKLDRSWGGGIRRDGSAYFRGTLAFRCDRIAGELTLDCGAITPEEGAELATNGAAARGAAQPEPAPTPARAKDSGSGAR
ncbi:MAG TPA: hypothetical protein VLM79_22270 [Kofleriaceae bacterium]|nr:hypothetical protein [Kofleriaceae bacterium]